MSREYTGSRWYTPDGTSVVDSKGGLIALVRNPARSEGENRGNAALIAEASRMRTLLDKCHDALQNIDSFSSSRLMGVQEQQKLQRLLQGLCQNIKALEV